MSTTITGWSETSDETVIGKRVQGMPKNVANFWMNYTMEYAEGETWFRVRRNFAGKAPYFFVDGL